MMSRLEEFITETLGLTKFPQYIPTFLSSFLGFLLVHQVFAPYFSRRWAPIAFGTNLKSSLARNTWAIHIVSQVHDLIVVPFAFWCIVNERPGRADEAAFGWDNREGHLLAIASGYFLWDAIDSVVNFIDAGYVVHGIACFLVYILSFRPYVAYYGIRCLLWEISTIFLNNHWFLDKLGRTGSRVQFINGLFLLTSFFCVRIVYGGSVSLRFFMTALEVKDEAPLFYTVFYCAGNVLLQGLNWFWFFKMITALRKRFDSTGERAKLLPGTPNGEGPH